MTGEVTARLYQAKDYAKALDEKERTGAIMVRWTHPTLGPCYEVRYVPKEKSPYRDLD